MEMFVIGLCTGIYITTVIIVAVIHFATEDIKKDLEG